MRKTFGIIVLALGLAFAVAPADAVNNPNPVVVVPICGHNNTARPPAPCTVPELAEQLREEVSYMRIAVDQIAAQRATIARQQHRIHHLRAVVRRLRAQN